ncbi:hypothetical protein HPB50_027368 [Hyalomma asiaticum]|uniref:Uncharacterized protein n=1 Tax=Hyalomma asiaticum TaxID=266040 RepID=A0ACB7TCD6_HYAAI|nr:hypothetical protein HPB50_027368 [Hyalomma asiaticum]
MAEIIAQSVSEDYSSQALVAHDGEVEVPTVYEIRFADDPTESTLQRKWSPAVTEQFILLRHEKRRFFNGKRNTTKALYQQILDEIGLGGVVTADQARKKWNNLMAKYRIEKTEVEKKAREGDPVPEGLIWPYYKLMDTVMKDIDGTLSVLMPSPQPRVQYLQQRYSIPSIQNTADGETLVETEVYEPVEGGVTEALQSMPVPLASHLNSAARRRIRRELTFEERLLKAVEAGNETLEKVSRTVETQADMKMHIASQKHTNYVIAAEGQDTTGSFFQKSCEESAIRAQCLFAGFLAEHNLPLSVSNHAGPLFRKMFPKCEDAKWYGCGRLKATAIVWEMAAGAENTMEALKRRAFAITVDGSNDSGPQMCPIVATHYVEESRNMERTLLCLQELHVEATSR